MLIMQLHNIEKYYGPEHILSQITMNIREKERIAIIGRNGSGKSTLLKIMAGIEAYDDGVIFKPKEVSIGYLPQHSTIKSKETIWDEMLKGFTNLFHLKQELQALERKFKQADTLSQEVYEKLLADYDQKLREFEKSGGYEYETTIKTVLSGLNFQESTYQVPIETLSGGQKTRLALGKLLIQSPDLLILDEPTNHLDITTLTWLESYLNNYDGAIIIVSHDRYFLDRTVHTFYNLSHQRIKKYSGPYQRYIEQKEKDYEKAMAEYIAQQEEIKRQEDFIQRNIARASTSRRAQSRRKQLEKMDRLEKPKQELDKAHFAFSVNKKSGYDVLNVENLAFQYEEGQKQLFSNLNLEVKRGERIALVGPNGVGKTTLLKLLLGKLSPTKGSIDIGTNIEFGYYDQEQSHLSPNKTVLQELWDEHPQMKERKVRNILGGFLFTQDEVLKSVQTLSGGEKARLALAKLMLERANVLILDEPTNHLDIESKEVLEKALKDFPGTIVFVSHDRYFINQIATKVVDLQPKGLTVYLGDYDYFVAKKQEEKERRAILNEKRPIKKTRRKEQFEKAKQKERERRRKERKVAQLEEQIAKQETTLNKLHEEMTCPDIYNDYEKSAAYAKHTEELKQEIETLMEQWEQLIEDLS